MKPLHEQIYDLLERDLRRFEVFLSPEVKTELDGVIAEAAKKIDNLGRPTKKDILAVILGHEPNPNENMLVVWIEDWLAVATLPGELTDRLVEYSRGKRQLKEIVEQYLAPACHAALQDFRMG